MADTWITDLTHFLDEEGNIISKPAQAKAIAEYLAAIVSMASFPDPEYPPEYSVKCRRRPNRKPCLERIVGFINLETDAIVWMCPRCKDCGTISNWRGTQWDLSSAVPPVRPFGSDAATVLRLPRGYLSHISPSSREIEKDGKLPAEEAKDQDADGLRHEQKEK
ncbi:MAG: hypothetical protein Q8P51_14450 [Ignavibacteria bacterium]|nr:hypothetical protein [Ignavibacteria bacterium]